MRMLSVAWMSVVLASTVLGAAPVAAQAQVLSEPTFKFMLDDMEFSGGNEPLVAGRTETLTVPVLRMCGNEIAVLDDQSAAITLQGEGFAFEAPLLVEFPQVFCYAPHGSVPVTILITPTGKVDGNLSIVVGVEPQEPKNGLHRAGQPITLLVGLVVANQTPPQVMPVGEAKESPAPAAVPIAAATVLALALVRRRRGPEQP